MTRRIRAVGRGKPHPRRHARLAWTSDGRISYRSSAPGPTVTAISSEDITDC